ncbi:hypothetical protein [Rhizorhabdus argentea]|uniref:hypothetical protein n=1 Tax=Rhizorhabdus argentea TaxID=1387174 RepID=UPI0030EC6378
MKAGTLDDNDNAVATLDGILAVLGSNYPQRFIETFEEQLRHWSIEAVAPASSGFSHDLSEPDPCALFGDQSVTLNWSQLVVSSAELFCERRHADAVALMHRVAAHVHAAHGNAEWRSYGVEQDFGGRLGKSMTVGISPTEDIRQICYAKTTTRVRVEIRYLRKVRASLRMDVKHHARPLFDLFAALQTDAAFRVDWKTFCKMCVEPPHAMLTEVSQMMALIAECARGAGVSAKPVFTALLTARSIAEDDSGDFPRRLMKRLEAAGLIDRQSLVRRVRPGERRRHRLTPVYFEIVGQLQQAFEQ